VIHARERRRRRSGPEEGALLVAGVVIETLPGCAPAVARKVARMPGLAFFGGDGDRHVVAVSRLRSEARLEGWLEALGGLDASILSVEPTTISEEDE
jgi:hypothetical protein